MIAGFQHETNTFANSRAGWAEFENGGGFPALRLGRDLLGLRDIDVPLGGFLEAMQGRGHHYLPVIWAAACPSGPVTRAAFERISAAIVEAARSEQPDAVYLDLHGAAVAEHVDDCEGELLARLRAVLPPQIPLIASLDLHANVSPQMLELADALVSYRTYPHVDMRATGARAAALLQARLDGSPRLALAWRQTPFLIALNAQCTDLALPRQIYGQLDALEQLGVQHLSFATGFPAADIACCGPALWGYGSDAQAVRAAVDRLADAVEAQEADWDFELLGAAEAVHRAIAVAATAQRPVVIADTQDNPGAGGHCNTTGMLRALLDAGAQDAALGLLHDPAAAAAAHAAGIGAEIELTLGGEPGMAGNEPLQGRFTVLGLGDGRVTLPGQMMNGVQTNLGPCAQLAIDGVRIAVSSGRMQMLDRALYRHVGIVPEAMKILVNKSSVHFRADFAPIAELVLVAQAAGAMPADPASLAWSKLPAGKRLRPGGPAFFPTSSVPTKAG
ncbi:MAG: M81 family metallopeptidase [Burkholderiaceae bacterium]|nr:M81 family metallopeptidase [Burkholderiaceae bacterium]